MLTKEKIISGIQKLPEPVTIEDVLDHIVLLEKIENGLEQSSKGQVITDKELDNKIGKWFE